MPAIWTSIPAVLLLELLYAAWLAAHVAAAFAAELMISCVTISGRRASNVRSCVKRFGAASEPPLHSA